MMIIKRRKKFYNDICLTDDIIKTFLNKYNWKILEIYNSNSTNDLNDYYSWWYVQKC